MFNDSAFLPNPHMYLYACKENILHILNILWQCLRCVEIELTEAFGNNCHSRTARRPTRKERREYWHRAQCLAFGSNVTSMALFYGFQSDFFRVTEKIIKIGIVEYSSEMFMTLKLISHRRLNWIYCEWIFLRSSFKIEYLFILNK